MLRLLFLTLLIPFPSFAADTRLELVREGNSVCKVLEKEKICYPVVEFFPEPFELTKEAEKNPGPYNVHQSKAITENYRRLSIRNFAVRDEGQLNKEASVIEYPFFATLYWQGRAYMEGTLHTQGYVRVHTNAGFSTLKKDSPPFEVHFTQFSDSKTEGDKVWLRFTEKSARYVHFLSIYGPKVNIEVATSDLLNRLVGPGIVAELFFSPNRK